MVNVASVALGEELSAARYVVAPLWDVNIAEVANAVWMAATIQKAIRYDFHGHILGRADERYRLRNGGYDLDRAVADLLRRKEGKLLGSTDLILVTSHPYSDPALEAEPPSPRLDHLYWLDASLYSRRRVSLVSTYIWDELSRRRRSAKTAIYRDRGLQSYVLFALATCAVHQRADMPMHKETRGCPFDYCESVQDIESFFSGGRICPECEAAASRWIETGSLEPAVWEAAKTLLERASRSNGPKVFVSYSWDGSEHEEWVQTLAARLRASGANVILDRWNIKPGENILRFVERAIRSADFVLMVCTEAYKRKFDNAEGVLGQEARLIRQYATSSGSDGRFFAVTRTRDWERVIPTFLGGNLHVDLSGFPRKRLALARLRDAIMLTR